MQQFLDQANLRGDLDELKDLDQQEYRDFIALDEAIQEQINSPLFQVLLRIDENPATTQQYL